MRYVSLIYKMKNHDVVNLVQENIIELKDSIHTNRFARKIMPSMEKFKLIYLEPSPENLDAIEYNKAIDEIKARGYKAVEEWKKTHQSDIPNRNV